MIEGDPCSLDVSKGVTIHRRGAALIITLNFPSDYHAIVFREGLRELMVKYHGFSINFPKDSTKYELAKNL